jgi:MFS family permease
VNWRCFSCGVGIGAEWGVGTSLLQEVWLEKWRTKGAGLLQSGFSIGGVLISGVWILVGSTPRIILALDVSAAPFCAARQSSSGSTEKRSGVVELSQGCTYFGGP